MYRKYLVWHVAVITQEKLGAKKNRPQARVYRRKQNVRGALKAEVVRSPPRLLQDNQPHLVRKKGAEFQECQVRQCPSVSVLFLGPYLYAVVFFSFLHVLPGCLVSGAAMTYICYALGTMLSKFRAERGTGQRSPQKRATQGRQARSLWNLRS